MKSVMLSIQPKWVEKIVKGEKTIEVRKTRPKIKTPFKCYIYCTYGQENENYMIGKRGKVIGEFVCDRIYEIKNLGSSFMIDNDIALTNLIARESCLEFPDLWTYLKDKNGYAWHISDLKIYGEPKELREFKRWNRTEENAPCAHTKWLYPDCKDCKACNLTRPPQSYMYVEEL